MASILVGEDDRDVTELLLILLDEAGYDVRHVSSGAEVLTAYAASRPDLVLLDIAMPGGLDGLEVTRLLRARADGSAPVMLLTARASEADRQAGLAAGADDYLVKPFDIEDMMARVEALLAAPPAAVRPRSAG